MNYFPILPIGLVVLLGSDVEAALQIIQFSKQPAGFSLTLTAENGRNYSVLSAPEVTGPWTERTRLIAISNSLSWIDTQLAGQNERYYRVYQLPGALVGSQLLAADGAPRLAGAMALDTASLGVQAAFQASILGAGGTQLLTNGTLTESGTNWSYAPTPNDRLLVQFQGGSNVTYYITRMQGDFTADAAAFLERPHDLSYRVVIPGAAELTFTNVIPTGTCNFNVTSQGSLVWNQTSYTIGLVMSGVYCIDNSFGYELLNDYTTTGNITAPGYALAVNQRWRHHLIGGGGGGASSVEDWSNNTLTLGTDVYRWDNTKKQKSFFDGQASSLDTYWQATGNVLKNGQAFGGYQMQYLPVAELVKFQLVLPGETVDLEVWPISP